MNARWIWLAVCMSMVSAMAAAAPQAVELKIATLAPDSTSWMKEIRAGAAEIESRTEGRVKLKFYPGGVMGNDQAMLRKIRIGQLQGGAITAGSLATVYPDAQIYSLPMLIRSIDEVNYVRKQMDDDIRQGLEKKGLVLVGISNGGFAYLGGRNPVAGLADLKQQRVWVPQGDKVAQTVLEAGGITPIPLPMSDVYTALQTGMIDTVAANPSSMIAFQWHTKIKYVTDSPLIFLVGMLVIDKRAFDKLQPQDQAVVRQVMAEKFRRLDELNQRDNEDARQALKANGVEFVQSTDTERASWLKMAEGSLSALQKEGAYSKEFLQELQKHLNVYRSGQASARVNAGANE